jgi:cation transport ATPase
VLNTKSLLKTTSLIPAKKPVILPFNTLNRFPKFYFSDKPPRGFEKFQRRKSNPPKEKTEVPEEKNEEKPSEEKNAENHKKEENDQKNNRSDSDGEDNKNNNNKKGDNNKGDFDKDTLINAGLASLIIMLGILNMYKTNSQEITMIVIIP